MKILHICHHFYPCVGGLETHLLDLCSHLVKLGHQSDVLCLDTCAKSRKKLKHSEVYKGIGITRIPYLDMKYYKISLPPKMLKMIKEYDIINVHAIGFFSDIFLLTKKIHRKPVILTTHGGFFHTKDMRQLKNFYLKWSKKILKKADKIVATGKVDYKIFSGMPNIELVPDSVNIDTYSKLKRNPKRNTLLHIGRIAKNKRIDLLINAVAKIKRSIPGIKLYVAGEDMEGLQKGLEMYARKLGVEKNVFFLRRVTDKKKLSMLRTCEFFVASSDYESFGISVLEAMASGVPVIANDIEAFRNLIKNGHNGYLADFSRPEEVANLIVKTSKNNLSVVSKNARKSSQQYSWERNIKKIVQIYKDAL